MFDEILGKVDYDQQLFKNKLKAQFEKHYKRNTVRISSFEYRGENPVEFFGDCFQSGGPKIKLFVVRILLPIFEEFNKSCIIVSNLDYDAGYFYADVQWRD
jgi:hypothetical protein